MLCEPAELELGHGLLRDAAAHGGLGLHGGGLGSAGRGAEQAGAVLGLGGIEKAPREEGRSDGEWGEERPAGATTDGGD